MKNAMTIKPEQVPTVDDPILPIKRRVSRKIWVGSVPIGGDAPISVQSMTNTETTDVEATVNFDKGHTEAGRSRRDTTTFLTPDKPNFAAADKVSQRW